MFGILLGYFLDHFCQIFRIFLDICGEILGIFWGYVWALAQRYFSSGRELLNPMRCFPDGGKESIRKLRSAPALKPKQGDNEGPQGGPQGDLLPFDRREDPYRPSLFGECGKTFLGKC